MPPAASPETTGQAGFQTVRGSAYGLELESDFALAGLGPPAGAERSTRLELVTDAVIEGLWRAETAVESRRLLHPGGGIALVTEHQEGLGWLVSAPGFGRHLVAEDGSRVRSAPAAIEPALWQLVLVGQALPAAAALAGVEVLHASAVAIGDAAVALTGPAGAGKSTLAAHLALLGAGFMTDDVLAVETLEGKLAAHSGLGVAAIRPPALPGLRRRGASHAATAPGQAKVELTFETPRRALPLRALYFLEQGRHGTVPHIEPLQPDPPRLLGSAFSVAIRPPARLARQLQVCATLAATVPCFTVRVPTAGDAGLAERLLQHASLTVTS